MQEHEPDQTEADKCCEKQNLINQGIAGKIANSEGNGFNSQGVPDKLPGRNDPCHCGSERKYKKCCSEKDADILQGIEDEKDTQQLIAMCDGKIPFQLPQAIKMLGAHSDGWMKNQNDDIKYLHAIIRALKTFPTTGQNSFVTLNHGNEIFTVNDLIAEYEGCLKEMEGELARKDYKVEYALCEFMKKDAFIGKVRSDTIADTAEKMRDMCDDDGCICGYIGSDINHVCPPEFQPKV